MKEIKFRVWDKNEQKWMDEDWVINQSIWQLNATESRYVWSQYTGLKDKNGVEIYEGDIVKQGKLTGPVEWSISSWRVRQRQDEKPLGNYGQPGLEVIGNIWQNPELLKRVA